MASEKCGSNEQLVTGAGKARQGEARRGRESDGEHQETFKMARAHWVEEKNLSGFSSLQTQCWSFSLMGARHLQTCRCQQSRSLSLCHVTNQCCKRVLRSPKKTNQHMSVLGHRLPLPSLYRCQNLNLSTSSSSDPLRSDQPGAVKRWEWAMAGVVKAPCHPPSILSVHFPFILSVKSLPVQHWPQH